MCTAGGNAKRYDKLFEILGLFPYTKSYTYYMELYYLVFPKEVNVYLLIIFFFWMSMVTLIITVKKKIEITHIVQKVDDLVNYDFLDNATRPRNKREQTTKGWGLEKEIMARKAERREF